MHIEGLLPANLCLVTLLSLEQFCILKYSRSNGKQNIQFQQKNLIHAQILVSALPILGRTGNHPLNNNYCNIQQYIGESRAIWES